jgi:hypothetical protein
MGQLLRQGAAVSHRPQSLQLPVQRYQAFAKPAVEGGSARRCLAAIQHFTIERVLELVALGDVAARQRVGVCDPQQVVPPSKCPAPILEVFAIQIPRGRGNHRGEDHPRDTGHLEDSLVIGAERLNLSLAR